MKMRLRPTTTDFLSSLPTFSSFLFYLPLLVAVSYLAINYLVYSRRVAQWKKSNIPFLKTSFLIGHKYFYNLRKNSIHVSLDRIYRENSDKDAIGFFIGTMPVVLLQNPALIKQVFVKNFDKAFSLGLTDSKTDEIAQNTVSMCADVNKWQSNRRMLSPFFTPSQMSGEKFHKVSRQIGSMMANLEEACSAGRPINTHEVSSNFFMDTFSRVIFGQEDDSYEKDGHLKRLISLRKPTVMGPLRVYAQMNFPSCALIFERFKLLAEEQVTLIRHLIRQQIEDRKQHDRHENDLVDFLMRLSDKDGAKEDQHESEIHITKQMIGCGLSMFGRSLPIVCIGASDSLSPSVFHFLSLRPDLQEKIRQEVSKAMEKHNTSELTYDVVQDLSFTHRCIYEAVRLLPPSAPPTRIIAEDFKVPGFDYTFKKGERVIVNPFSVHRDPAFFKNPDEFDPERFSPENIKDISPDSYLPFGTGPRKCPGFKLGFMIDATLIASIMQKYVIKPHSHMKQMDVKDLHNLYLGSSTPWKNILVDIVPREITVQ